jgi:hypothetical protein
MTSGLLDPTLYQLSILKGLDSVPSLVGRAGRSGKADVMVWNPTVAKLLSSLPGVDNTQNSNIVTTEFNSFRPRNHCLSQEYDKLSGSVTT